MSETVSPHLELPAPVREWVQANPLPTVLLTEDLVTLSANAAFSELLTQLELRAEELLLRGLLTEELSEAGSGTDFFSTLQAGTCLVRQLVVSESEHYTFHLIKLTLPASAASCLCCMLLPGEDPEHVHLTGILNTISCFVVEFDSRGSIIYINDHLLLQLGFAPWERPELIRLHQLENLAHDTNLMSQAKQAEARGLSNVSAEFIKRDGTVFPVEVCIVARKTPTGSVFLLTARDLTAQLAREVIRDDTLLRSEQQVSRITQENIRLQTQIDHHAATDLLIHQSAAYEKVIKQVRLVAPTDATVLITGETGTGKELIARTIHRLSRRADQPFVTVDCGCLPRELIESELFGYKKGAFTGADKDRQGRIAAADQGTLFLDEIGELPLLMQTRLLRVLQEGEYTRLGDNQVRKVDVRVIAATNRDLHLRIAQNSFRSDLFYRLNVFPIVSIPLRERKEDLDILIRHFIKKFNQKYSRKIAGLAGTPLEPLSQYDFPGNVRELENMVERGFIVSNSNLISLTVPSNIPPLPEHRSGRGFDDSQFEAMSFEEGQRRHIQFVLNKTEGKVSGKDGAAQILKMNPQTLFSKMRKLGIRHSQHTGQRVGPDDIPDS